MLRKNLVQILKDAKVDVQREYERLFELFYGKTGRPYASLKDFCNHHFLKWKFRGTALSTDDFEESYYGGRFELYSCGGNLDVLVTFCEYTCNLVLFTSEKCGASSSEVLNRFTAYLNQVLRVIDLIEYQTASPEKEVLVFVPKSQEALAVAEISDKNLSYSVLEYNHHSLKGDLSRKKAILKNMADDLEPHKNRLNSINKTFRSNLSHLFDKFVRHNNSGNPYIQNMSDAELENCYDDIYQMWLLAKLELDNVERKSRVEDLLRKINATGKN